MGFIITLLICFLSGCMAGTFKVIVASLFVGVFIGTVVQVCIANFKKQYCSDNDYLRSIKERDKQEQYDNYWGIIDWDDRKNQ